MMLFAPYRLGGPEPPNRILMATMTRARAGERGVPVALNADYSAQRADAGLIITEGTQPSPTGQGHRCTAAAAAPRRGWRMLTSRPARLALLTVLGTVLAAATITASASAAAQRYAGPTGAGTACTSASPCSIKDAIDGAASGDEVIVNPGDYPLTATLTDGNQITIHGVAGQPRPRLRFSGPGQNGLWLESGSTLRYVEVDQAAGDNGQIAVGAFTGSKVDQVIAKAPAIAAEIRNSTIRNSIAVASGTNGRALSTAAVGSYTNTSTYRNVTAIATGGGGVAIEAQAMTFSHASILARNVIAYGAEYSFVARTDSTSGATATITVDHSNWLGGLPFGSNASIMDGGGNQSSAPAFVDEAGGDYRQANGSPTIDAGINEPINGAFDVDGDPRTLGTTDIGAGTTDIGADEFVVAPAATTGPATAVTDRAATLSGSVNARGVPTSYHFEYGPTTAYGSTTPTADADSGRSAVAAAATLGGLSPATTYHYRLVATNAGGVTHGADHTFDTAASAPPTIPPPTTQPPTIPPPTTQPPAAFAGVKLVSTRLTFARRFITLRLTCPAATVGRCSGHTKLTARRRRTTSPAGSRVTLGRATFSIASGQRARVRVRVARAGRRRLSGVRRLRGRVRNAAHDGAGQAETTVARVTIRCRHG